MYSYISSREGIANKKLKLKFLNNYTSPRPLFTAFSFHKKCNIGTYDKKYEKVGLCNSLQGAVKNKFSPTHGILECRIMKQDLDPFNSWLNLDSYEQNASWITLTTIEQKLALSQEFPGERLSQS